MIKPFDNWREKCQKSRMFGSQVFGIQMITEFEYRTSLVLRSFPNTKCFLVNKTCEQSE